MCVKYLQMIVVAISLACFSYLLRGALLYCCDGIMLVAYLMVLIRVSILY